MWGKIAGWLVKNLALPILWETVNRIASRKRFIDGAKGGKVEEDIAKQVKEAGFK